MKRSYFITATGTDLGKTWVAAGLLRACRARGMPVRALKPVMSGWDEARSAESDAAMLLAASGRDASPTAIAEISPWRFKAALSPDRAAALEGKAIDFAALVAWCHARITPPEADGLLLIEGIGGVMVPLDARNTVRELIAALAIPAVLVAGSYLGSLSHTLTALAALREVGITPAAIVLNESENKPVDPEDTSSSLAPYIGAVPLLALRRDDSAGIERLAELLLAD